MSPRRRARDRLPELADAAVRVFTQKGYRAAQMADIAAEMGVSEAALYRYVESKEGLFHLVVRHSLLLEDLPDDELPLASPSLDVTIKELRAHLQGAASFQALDAALARRRVRDATAELEALVRQFYGLCVQTSRAMDMIEASASEVPALAELVDVELRRPLLQSMATYLDRRARAGHLRATPDPAATARLIVETVRWFARNRSAEAGADPDAAAIADDVAEATVVDLLVHALVPCPDRPGAR